MSRRLLMLPALLAVLALPASASAIVYGDDAAAGEYPAQGYLGVDANQNGQIERACGGTLVGSRQFLTAAHCLVTAQGLPLTPASFSVRLGVVDLADNGSPPRAVAARELHPGFVNGTLRNDVAMLTLEQPTDPAEFPPLRVVDDNEDARWAPGIRARVLGWGLNEFGNPSDVLLTGDVPIITDAACTAARGAAFDPELMVCAAHPASTPVASRQDVCDGDGGGPLLAPEGSFFVLAGVASRDTSCGDPAAPGVYTRIGDNAAGSNLNDWVHDRTPEANYALSHQPRVGEPVMFTSTSTHPEPGYFTTFKWDFDNDGRFDDRSGMTVSHTFTRAGEAVVGLEASRPGGDRASAYFAFDVLEAPGSGGTTTPPAPTPTAPPTTTPPASRATPALASILVTGRPRVRGRRFRLRVRFARSAPRGIAVIEVYRGRRRIGIARTRVRRGATKRVTVRLTPGGRRMLRRSANGRLRIRARVRVGRRVLATRRLTIRR